MILSEMKICPIHCLCTYRSRRRRSGAPLPEVQRIRSDSTRRADTPLFYVQKIADRFERAKQNKEAGRYGLHEGPFAWRKNKDGSWMMEGLSHVKTPIQYFPAPYLELTPGGFLFEAYKGRFALFLATMATKLAQSVGTLAVLRDPHLYRCPGVPA